MAAAILLAAAPSLGQVVRPVRPEDLGPVKPKEPAKPRRLPELGPPLVDVPDDVKILVAALKGVRFVRRPADVVKAPQPAGIDTRAVKLLDNDEFRARLKRFLGKGVSWRSIGQMERITILYFRQKGRPVVSVSVPPQDISNGVVQLLVIEGRVGQVKVEGNKWFGIDQIREKIYLQPGDVIYADRLLEDIRNINANPFRYVRPVLSPGKELGQTDLTLQTRDRFPMSFYIGYEDTGSRLTGLGRYLTGFNIGNAFGKEHEIGYQFATNDHFTDVGIHSAYYRIPLANRHKVSLFASYAEYDARHNDTDVAGRSWQLSGRYIAPLRPTRRYHHEIQAGLDYKRTDSCLHYAGVNAYDSAVDVMQFVLQYGGFMEDKMGRTSFTGTGYYSPGMFAAKQSEHNYDAAREDADPQYAYFNMNLERVWDLPGGASLVNRFTGQCSTDRLLGSEQLGLGGYATVRGFDEREVNADNGVMVSVELRSPELDLGNIAGRPELKNHLQFLGFWDYGHARNISEHGGEDKTSTLQSVGLGLRYRLSNHVTLRCDYGFRLTNPDTFFNDQGRLHFGLVVRY
ncbi:MAG: ShlB/FhaC/HecB family hemolysin secretion/activation protein [Phycisphaerae bacterium]|nr:ShlB/FhaC/HecB family hemolysin secretion/activation protein [Phycisphaerae bacterium]